MIEDVVKLLSVEYQFDFSPKLKVVLLCAFVHLTIISLQGKLSIRVYKLYHL